MKAEDWAFPERVKKRPLPDWAKEKGVSPEAWALLQVLPWFQGRPPDLGPHWYYEFSNEQLNLVWAACEAALETSGSVRDVKCYAIDIMSQIIDCPAFRRPDAQPSWIKWIGTIQKKASYH